MKSIYLALAFTLALSVVSFIPRSNASNNPKSPAPAPPVLHPSRAIDTAGFFFAHDLRSESNGAMTLITTVGTTSVTLPDGSKVAGGEIRVMEYLLETDSIAAFLDNPAKYDALVANQFQDSVVELQFRSQLASYRGRAIDVAGVQSKKAARILSGKYAPAPVLNSTTMGTCAVKP